MISIKFPHTTRHDAGVFRMHISAAFHLTQQNAEGEDREPLSLFRSFLEAKRSAFGNRPTATCYDVEQSPGLQFQDEDTGRASASEIRL